MTSIEERLQLKREPLDKWSIREKLCLAVAWNNDQNLTSVSRALKPFGEANRPADWFHQKNCAAQYGALLENVETPKRKKRTSSAEIVIETPAEAVIRKLLAERKVELQKLMAEEKAEYQKLQKDMALLQSGNVSEEQLDIWCKEIEKEEEKKEQEAVAHEQWLRQRELRKQEIERSWRPLKTIPLVGQKRKISETVESPAIPPEPQSEELKSPIVITPQEAPKPALSPLLTSLLKSPSQSPNVTTSSILHTAITQTQQRPTSTNTNPMIASLLNCNTGVTVSPGLQQLVTSAIGQAPEDADPQQLQQQTNDILDDPNLQILKIDDLANSILIENNGPLPEIKNEVDVIISDLIDNAHDIVADPEQHLQLDGNGDINISLELDDFEDNEDESADKEMPSVAETIPEKGDEDKTKTVDPFEFHDEPEVFECSKPLKQTETIVERAKETGEPETVVPKVESPVISEVVEPEVTEVEQEEEVRKDKGSVEIVELVLDDDEDGKELSKPESKETVEKEADIEVKKEPKVEDLEETKQEPVDESQVADDDKIDETLLPTTSTTEVSTIESEYNEELYDDVTMEVKIDKSGKAKRDYSRTKKKEEKDFDLLSMSLDKTQQDSELADDTLSDYSEHDKKDIVKIKIKTENDRSNSPWTEEEELSSLRSVKRRVSTPATPSLDSGSPVSICEDDREYRNWKKSVMLVYSRLAANKCSSLFLKPITDDQAPGYHGIVHRPMDLLTIRKNIENGTIRTTQEFQRDVLLMFNNAIMYNKTNGTVYNMARQMQQESLQSLQILLQAHAQLDIPGRRETRTSEPGLKRKRGGNGASEEVLRSAKKRKDD